MIQKRIGQLLCVSLLLTSVDALAGPNQPLEATSTGNDGWEPNGLAEERRWAVTVDSVWLSEEQLGDMLLFQAALTESQLWSVAVSRKLASFNEHSDFEFEGQVAKHAGPLQRHWEFNGLGVYRWHTFPWDRHINTSVAFGLGLSYALDKPAFEVQAHEKSNRLLVYILVELAVALPRAPRWEIVARIHHRSAAYGIFENDLQGASNGLGFGLKYRF